MNHPSAIRIFFKTIVARAYPRFVGSHRNLTWLVTETLLPLIGTIAMIYVYRALHAPARYLGFVVLGGVLLAFWQNVIWSMATQFFWDRGGGNLELFAMAVVGHAGGNWEAYVATFTLSYLVGYLWLPAPGGLGAREWAMSTVFVALKLGTPAEAAVVTVASRLWLTVLEIVPGLVYLVRRPRKSS